MDNITRKSTWQMVFVCSLAEQYYIANLILRPSSAPKLIRTKQLGNESTG